MPRHDLKAYATLSARLPQDLVDAVKHYASLHRLTVSELIRDSLQVYLDADGADRPGSSGQEVLYGHTEVLREVLQKVLQSMTEVRHEVRHGHGMLVQAIAALAVQGKTEVRHDISMPAGGRTEVLHGHTSQDQVAPAVDAHGQTEVFPAYTSGPDREGLTSVIYGQTEVRPGAPGASFDPTKYRLGKLCPRGHDYQGTGQSLLRIANDGCLVCDRERARERRQQKRQQEVSA
jgi:hypothetical protein